MQNSEYKHSDLTAVIIGLAKQVHQYFGAGFSEYIYQRALMIELEREGLKFDCEKEYPIFYKGIFIKKRRLDLLVEDAVIVEIKAIRTPDNGDVNQVLNYLRICRKEAGLLFNFGNKSLYFKRYINTINLTQSP